jgi:hypothetical protein
MSRLRRLRHIASAMTLCTLSYAQSVAQSNQTRPDSLILENGAIVKPLSHDNPVSDHKSSVMSAYYINKTIYADQQGYKVLSQNHSLQKSLSTGLDNLYRSHVASRDTIQGHLTLYAHTDRHVLNAESYKPNPWSPHSSITKELHHNGLNIAAFNDAATTLYDRVPFQNMRILSHDSLTAKHAQIQNPLLQSNPKP